MAIDFPASPTVNQEYTFEGRTWTWNGAGWTVKNVPVNYLPVSRSVSIASPSATEKLVLGYFTISQTITIIESIVLGTTPSVTFSIRYGTDVSLSGTEVVTGGITCTNSTNGLSTTVFNNSTIPINNFVWLTTSAVTGTVNSLNVSVVF